MDKTTFHLFFEAHSNERIPDSHATPAALENHLMIGYHIQRIRTDSFVKLVADILHTDKDAAGSMLKADESEKLKLMALFSRLAIQAPDEGKFKASFSQSDIGWHSFNGHERWNSHLRTPYSDSGSPKRNKNASLSNFPRGGSKIPEKVESDHRLNYFLWSLWEGLSPQQQAALPHMKYERQSENPKGTGLASRFVSLLLEAEKRLQSWIVSVEGKDPRHWEGRVLPHTITQEHVAAVCTCLEALLSRAKDRSTLEDPLRVELLKHAALNMALNQLDGIEQLDAEAKLQIPLQLDEVLALSATDIFSADSSAAVLDALQHNFCITHEKIPDDLLTLAEKLAAIYVDQRRPVDRNKTAEFARSHISARSVGIHAALLLHDHLHKVKVSRQVAGDTTAKVAAFAGFWNYCFRKEPLTETHFKFYLNRYAAIFYGFTEGYSLEQGVTSFYEARKTKRWLNRRLYAACRTLDSTSIADLVPLLTPEPPAAIPTYQVRAANVVYRFQYR